VKDRVVCCPKCGTTRMDRVALADPKDEKSVLLFRCGFGHLFMVCPRRPRRNWFLLDTPARSVPSYSVGA